MINQNHILPRGFMYTTIMELIRPQKTILIMVLGA